MLDLPSENYSPKFKSHVSNWHGLTPFAADLVHLMTPRCIVELGTHYGDSFFSFCQASRDSGVSVELYAVDHWNGDVHSGFYDDKVYRGVLKYAGCNYSKIAKLLRMNFDSALERFKEQSIDILHIDGMHDYGSVKNDFRRWLPKVSKSGAILIHDILIRDRGFGVYKFWKEIKDSYSHIELNFSCGLGVLFNPDNCFLSNLCDILDYQNSENFHSYYLKQHNRIITEIQ
jgi:hypothetical protein